MSQICGKWMGLPRRKRRLTAQEWYGRPGAASPLPFSQRMGDDKTIQSRRADPWGPIPHAEHGGWTERPARATGERRVGRLLLHLAGSVADAHLPKEGAATKKV